jgi:hypothetical protein
LSKYLSAGFTATGSIWIFFARTLMKGIQCREDADFAEESHE